MAQGRTASVKGYDNNKKETLVTKQVELVVVGGVLVPHENELNPGVNTATLKN